MSFRIFIAFLFTMPAATTAAAPARATVSKTSLAVDARDVGRRLLHVRERVPAPPGTLALSSPKSIPGEHGPTGPLTEILNLVLTADGRRLQWRRDDVDMYTIGCEVRKGAGGVDVVFDFALTDVVPGSAADRAGVVPDMTLVAVNGRAWTPEILREAIRRGRDGGPLELPLRSGDFYRSCRVEHREGLRYPKLARARGTPDRVGAILEPRTGSTG